MSESLVGRKVRLTGSGWGYRGLPQVGSIFRIKGELRPGYSVTVEGFSGVVFLGGSGIFEGVLVEKKRPVYVVAWAGESSGGFDWSLNVQWARARYNEMLVDGGPLALVEIKVDVGDMSVEARDLVTEHIDGELQDAIAMGLVGKILARTV